MRGRTTIIAAAAALTGALAGGGLVVAGQGDEGSQPADAVVLQTDGAAAQPDVRADADAGDSGRPARRPRSPRRNAGSRQPVRLVIDDGIPVADARRAARAAESRFGGRALTVDEDDGLFEVELQQADGRIYEVYVDHGFRALRADPDALD